jgi:hypothetical protein
MTLLDVDAVACFELDADGGRLEYKTHPKISSPLSGFCWRKKANKQQLISIFQVSGI